jgi:hypothetical protein
MAYRLGTLGRDDELRAVLQQQGQVIHDTWAQSDKNAEMQLNKKQAFMVVLAIMAVLVIFK